MSLTLAKKQTILYRKIFLTARVGNEKIGLGCKTSELHDSTKMQKKTDEERRVGIT